MACDRSRPNASSLGLTMAKSGAALSMRSVIGITPLAYSCFSCCCLAECDFLLKAAAVIELSLHIALIIDASNVLTGAYEFERGSDPIS
jgi:hypothetical protein